MVEVIKRAGQLPPPGLARERGYRVFWGDLHGHTNVSSDWSGKTTFGPAEYFNAAKSNGLHFAAITDHADDICDREWSETLKQASIHHSPNEFIPFVGYEVCGSPLAPCEADCVNVVFPGLEGGTVYGNDTCKGKGKARPDSHLVSREKMWSSLHRTGAIGISVHTTPEPDFSFGPRERVAIRAVEVYTTGGRTHDDDRYPASLAETAVMLGFRAGFVGTGNNHMDGPGLDGLTAVLARSLSRKHIWEAITRRRVFAVRNTDDAYGNRRERVIISFDAWTGDGNRGLMMGEEAIVIVNGDGSAPVTLEAVALPDFTRPIEHMKLAKVSPGKAPIEFGPVPGATIRVSDVLRCGETAAYYATAQLQGSTRAAVWSSPIWFTAVPRNGAS